MFLCWPALPRDGVARAFLFIRQCGMKIWYFEERGAGKIIDQRGMGRCRFNTENATFENFPPEIVNFAEMKGFS